MGKYYLYESLDPYLNLKKLEYFPQYELQLSDLKKGDSNPCSVLMIENGVDEL